MYKIINTPQSILYYHLCYYMKSFGIKVMLCYLYLEPLKCFVEYFAYPGNAITLSDYLGTFKACLKVNLKTVT